MAAGDRVPEFYFRAKALIQDLPPLQVGPDLPPGSADAECKYENGNTYVRVREDYPSPLLTQAQQDIECENTFFHEFGHAYDKYLTEKGRDHHVRYFAFRKFPTTWDQAQKDADTMGSNSGWQWQPRESWAECFGAAMSGRWTKPEKTMNWNKPADALAARAFFQSLGGTTIPKPPEILPPSQRAIEWRGPVPNSNFAQGRGGNSINLIVDHWMATTFDGALAHFLNGNAQVSAHYLISQQGRIVQVVRDEDTAYHAGNWNVNQTSIGIEHEGGPNLPPFTPELYTATAWLHHKLSLDYGIRLVVGETVRRHSTVVPTACPGTLDLDRIVAEAGGEDLDRATFNQWFAEQYLATVDPTIVAMKQTYDPLVPQAHPKTHKHDTVVDQPPMVVTTGDPK